MFELQDEAVRKLALKMQRPKQHLSLSIGRLWASRATDRKSVV